MNDRKRFLVELHGHANPFILPAMLTAALTSITCSGSRGINTAELEYEGFVGVHKLINRLRERGVPIITTRWPVLDEKGNIHNGIAYYNLARGDFCSPQNITPESPVSVTRLSDFKNTTSKIEGKKSMKIRSIKKRKAPTAGKQNKSFSNNTHPNTNRPKVEVQQQSVDSSKQSTVPSKAIRTGTTDKSLQLIFDRKSQWGLKQKGIVSISEHEADCCQEALYA